MLHRVKIPKPERRMILAIFAATMICSVPAIAYAVLQAVPPNANTTCHILLVMHIKMAITLLVCNLIIVVPYIYSLCCKDSDADMTYATRTIPPDGILELTEVTTAANVSNSAGLTTTEDFSTYGISTGKTQPPELSSDFSSQFSSCAASGSKLETGETYSSTMSCENNGRDESF